ncbi:hypothetical protein AB0H57_09955 [Micromonospora sp. NPDC050686]|uniref:hypothetical protein n=1 Tax=Micromonospora sp. NPDC050686 TaxID=3154631 RepID=UPI00340F7251
MSAEQGDQVGLSADARDHARVYQAGRDLYVNHAVPARSGYLQQVRRLAPEVLRDRDAELAELAAFCTAPDGPAYAWWRAGPWAGKSALMSWFVLHPPPGVRVVSFFVTARFAGSSDRGAFLDNLSVQLAELLAEPAPTGLPEAVREGYLLDLLDRAAGWCADRGERLVLLVDGLDEDRGVCVGPDAHSIAALLPDRPGHGMRVLVAGRPNPPIPTDVPHRHPLRDPAVVRTLAVSPHAQAVRHDANGELRRLLDGTDLQRDLLGLLTAAVGGLSGADLTELTGADQWQVEEHLHTVSGRTFLTQASRWRPEDGPQVYVLGHEELQQSARHYLGPARLAGYRRRLHDWADGYRRRGWPEGTPEYLLRGWFRLLRDTGEVDRMVACGTDQVRHDRMLDLSGGDVTALEEIRTAQDAVLAAGEPDLVTLARLAVHARQLDQRNTRIPRELPAVWVALGHPARADALARSIGDESRRNAALREIATTFSRGGDTGQAEKAALAIADEHTRSRALWFLAGDLVDAGRFDRAASIADAIPQATERARSFASIADARLRSGDPAGGMAAAGRAEEAALRIDEPGEQARALADLALLVAGQGGAARAGDLVRRAEVAADRVAKADERVWILVRLASRWLESGDVERARRVADQAAATALSTTATERRRTDFAALAAVLLALGDGRQVDAVVRLVSEAGQPAETARLVPVLAKAGDWTRATAIAESIMEDAARVTAFTALAGVADMAGDAAGARHWLHRAEAVARPLGDPHRGPVALVALARELARQGDHVRAGVLAEAIADAVQRVETLCLVARLAGGAGQGDAARSLAARAAAVSETVDGDPSARGRIKAEVVSAAISAGDSDSATAIARTIGDPGARADALTRVAAALVRSGDAGGARRLAHLAEAAYRSAGGPQDGTSARMARVTGLAASGAVEAAEAAADSLVDPDERAWALYALARWLGSATGEPAPALIERARTAARAIDREDRRSRILLNLSELARNRPLPAASSTRAVHIWLPSMRQLSARVEKLVAAGDLAGARQSVRQAEPWARALPDPDERQHAIGVLTRLHGLAGDIDSAEALSRGIERRYDRVDALTGLALAVAAAGDPGRAEAMARRNLEPSDQAHVLTELAKVVAVTGPPEHAEALTRSIPDGRRRDVGLTGVAEVLARAGHLDRAEAVARSIVGPFEQAKALTAVAEHADPGRARRLVALALRLGDWFIPLELLPRVDPAACLAVADEYFRLNPDQAASSSPAG